MVSTGGSAPESRKRPTPSDCRSGEWMSLAASMHPSTGPVRANSPRARRRSRTIRRRAPSRLPTPRSVSAVHGGGDTTHVCGGHRIGLHQLGEPITGDGESDQVGVDRHSGRTHLPFDRASLSHHLIG